MAWSLSDARAAIDFVRDKAQAATDLLLLAARPVLQYGSRDEVGHFGSSITTYTFTDSFCRILDLSQLLAGRIFNKHL